VSNLFRNHCPVQIGIGVQFTPDFAVKGRFDQIIVFRHSGGELPFKDFLKEIILDDPEITRKKDGLDYFSMSYGALLLSMTEGGIDVPIRKRSCKKKCSCLEDYRNDKDWTRNMFLPKI